MIIWWFLYLIAAISPLLIRRNRLLYLFTIGAVSTSDAYGIYFLGATYTPFSIFTIVSLICLIKNNKIKYSDVIAYLNNRFLLCTVYLVVVNIIVGFIYDGNNYLLYIRPLILIIQWLIIWLYYISNKDKFSKKENDISFICLTITIYTAVIIIYQQYGFQFDLVRQSTTYEISDVITFGGGITRPLGLTREPAHLSIVAILVTGMAFYLKRFEYKLLCLWIIIGLISETRSIVIFSIISPIIYLIFKINKNNLVKLIIIVGIISFYLIKTDRGISALEVTSDMSTQIRYGSIIASLNYYINNFYQFLPVGKSTILFCDVGYEYYDISQYCNLFEGAILNSTINHLIQAPFFINIFILICFFITSKLANKLLILIFLLSGMIMYAWAYPALGIMFLFAAILNIDINEKYNNLQRK